MVESAYYYYPSTNVTGPEPEPGQEEIFGYDLAVSLGSKLDFGSLTVELIPSDGLTLGGQNMGLDLSDGIVKVTLSPSAERYYFSANRQ